MQRNITDVLRLLEQGFSLREIAALMGINPSKLKALPRRLRKCVGRKHPRVIVSLDAVHPIADLILYPYRVKEREINGNN